MFSSSSVSPLSGECCKLVVDYAVHYMKAKGETKPKVFKLKNLDLPARQSTTLAAKISFKPISTRKHHAGAHAVEVLVNGVGYGESPFVVLA